MLVTYESVKKCVDKINAGTQRSSLHLQLTIDRSKPSTDPANVPVLILENIIKSIDPEATTEHNVFADTYFYKVKAGTHLDDDPMAIFYLLTQVENQINKIKDAQDRVAFYVLLIMWIAVFLPFLCIGILLVI